MEEYYNEARDFSSSLGKVFLYLFLGLGVSGGSSFGIFFILRALFSNNVEEAASVYLGTLVFSSIAVFILTLVAQIFCLRGKEKGGLITYILYTLFMGILLSSLMLFFDMTSIGYAFLCTAVSFGAMAIYGAIAKKGVNTLGMIGTGFLFGALVLCLINLFVGSQAIDWAITYIMLFAMLAITGWDVYRAKQLADQGSLTKSMAIYMALQLYTDFVYILIRFIALIGRNRK